MARGGVIPLGLRKGEGVMPPAPMSNFTNKPLSILVVNSIISLYIDGEGGDTPRLRKGEGVIPPQCAISQTNHYQR